MGPVAEGGSDGEQADDHSGAGMLGSRVVETTSSFTDIYVL